MGNDNGPFRSILEKMQKVCGQPVVGQTVLQTMQS